MIKRICTIFIVLLLLCSENRGAYDDSFSQTARIAGSGNSGSALPGDLSSVYLNPAGLTGISRIHIMGDMYNLYQAGFNNTFIGLYCPFLYKGGLGVAWQRINYEEALEFDDKEDIFYCILAKDLFGVGLGVTGKYFKEVINTDDVKVNTKDTDFDIGLRTEIYRFGIGLSLINIQPLFKEHKSRTGMVNFGVYYRFLYEIMILYDYKYTEAEHKMSFGIVYPVLEEFSIRSGWYMDFYYSLGFSYYIRDFRLDYAYAVNQFGVGSTHYFSLSYFIDY